MSNSVRAGPSDPNHNIALDWLNQLRYVGRFQDDSLNINSNLFRDNNKHWVYQTVNSKLQFTISDNGSGVIGAEYMDVNIFQNPYYPCELLTRLHDKQRGANFDDVHIVQYCHVSSYLPSNTKQNIFTGQYHRLSRLLTCERAFHVEIAIVTFKMTEAGYNRKQLRNKLDKLLRNSPLQILTPQS
jgi:hypothetical protein